MDIDSTITDKKLEIEDMDIEIAEKGKIEDKIDNLSFKMDTKIKAKQKQLEEEEIKLKEVARRNELKRLSQKENEAEKQRKEKKLIKQRSKNIRKSANKRKKIADSDDHEKFNCLPSLKEVPQFVKDHVNQGDVVYQVPADGACLPNCAAAFFFQDEVFGPKL